MAYVGCDGIVIRDGNLLLQRREDFKTWGQPGGGLEPGEYLLDSVRREVREETGVVVEPERLLAVHYRRWLGRDVLVFSFVCRPTGGALRTGPETIDVRYFPTGELPVPMHPLARERLHHALRLAGDDRFGFFVQSSSRSAQLVHAVKLLWRTARNRVQRRPAWRPAAFAIGAFATLWNEESGVLLLHRRDQDAWNLPGGRVEKGESPWSGCAREVQEETGLDVRIGRLTGVYAKTHKNELVFNFEAQVVGGRLQPTDEADQGRFFRLPELPDTLLSRQRERILDAALALRTERHHPVVREQGADWESALERRSIARGAGAERAPPPAPAGCCG